MHEHTNHDSVRHRGSAALVDDEEIAFLMADALETSDAAYSAKALGVIARAKGLSKLSLQRIKTVVLLMPSDQPWGILPTALPLFELGLTLERSQPDEQVREILLP